MSHRTYGKALMEVIILALWCSAIRTLQDGFDSKQPVDVRILSQIAGWGQAL